MVEEYIRTNENAAAVCRSFEHRYERPAPHRSSVSRLIQKWRTLHIVHNKKRRPAPRKLTEEFGDNLENYYHDHPHTPIWFAAELFDVCEASILKVLKSRRFKPYRATWVQSLTHQHRVNW